MRGACSETIVAAFVVAGLPLTLAAVASATDPPLHHIVIGGVDITPSSTWPAFDAAIERYAVSTTAATAGTLTVQATTTDPAGVVRINGRVAPGGAATLPGLAVGDEVNVQITDAGGTSNQSYFYLPPGFPTMSSTSSGAGPTPGYVFLTTTGFLATYRFETVVDSNGVPIYVHQHINPMDLKLQPNGRYSVARGLTGQLDSTFDIVELDSRFEPVATYTNPPPLQNTEFHDSVLLPGGGRVLMAYEQAPTPSTDIDSVVQEVEEDGSLGLTWNSADHTVAQDRLTSLDDYAHLNSIEVMHDGNLLLSFRHLSQVMKVDRQTGAVIWRLGGPRSDFTFPDDPEGGPCAQHTARELPSGDIQVWDNGSEVGAFTLEPLCPDPQDPTGLRTERPFSRVVTYHLDETTNEATLVDEFRPFAGASFSEFAGSAQRLGGGTLDDNVLLGMADAHDPDTNAELPDVLEVDADDQVVWSLDIPGIFSYRALKFPAPDAIAPTVTLGGVVDGATYVAGATRPTVRFTCADRGGANLATCAGTVADGAPAPMTVGQHTVTVTATDRGGNKRQASLSYTVVAGPPTPTTPPPWAPDARIRKAGESWLGAGLMGSADGQTVKLRLGSGATDPPRVLEVRVRNAGVRRDRVRLTGTGGSPSFRVRYVIGGNDVTADLRQGLLTPRLEPGEAFRLRILVTRTGAAHAGDSRRVKIVAVSRHDGDAVDRVAARLKAR